MSTLFVGQRRLEILVNDPALIGFCQPACHAACLLPACLLLAAAVLVVVGPSPGFLLTTPYGSSEFYDKVSFRRTRSADFVVWCLVVCCFWSLTLDHRSHINRLAATIDRRSEHACMLFLLRWAQKNSHEQRSGSTSGDSTNRAGDAPSDLTIR